MMCKKGIFYKTNIQKKIFKISNMVQNTYNTRISIIQQYDILNLKKHARQGLEIGHETTDANQGIKLSRRRTS